MTAENKIKVKQWMGIMICGRKLRTKQDLKNNKIHKRQKNKQEHI